MRKIFDRYMGYRTLGYEVDQSDSRRLTGCSCGLSPWSRSAATRRMRRRESWASQSTQRWDYSCTTPTQSVRTQSIHQCSLSAVIIIKRSLFTINLINYTIYLPKGCELKVSCGGGRERGRGRDGETEYGTQILYFSLYFWQSMPTHGESMHGL